MAHRNAESLDFYTALFAAHEAAKSAYGDLVTRGWDRPDSELARDSAYNDLLRAGVTLYRLGGTPAVGAAAAGLNTAFAAHEPADFARLWCGMMPEASHLSSLRNLN